MGWKVYGMGRSFEGEDMDRELEKAYKEGYRDAMEEMDGRYGERGLRPLPLLLLSVSYTII